MNARKPSEPLTAPSSMPAPSPRLSPTSADLRVQTPVPTSDTRTQPAPRSSTRRSVFGRLTRPLPLLFTLPLLTLGACTHHDATKAPASPSLPSISTLPQDTSAAPTPPPPLAAKIEAQLEPARTRQACNRVTGCDALKALAKHGEDLIPIAHQALLAPERDNLYWTIALPKVLARTRSPKATDTLVQLTDDRHWDVQTAAILSLTDLGPYARDAIPRLQALYDTLEQPDLGTGARTLGILALGALSRIDEPNAAAHRAAYLGLLPATEEQALTVPLPILDLFVEQIGFLRLTEGLHIVHAGLKTQNRFVSATALQVTTSMRDKGAIRSILPLVENENPTLRRMAASTLQSLTGHSEPTIEGWQRWLQTQAP